MEESFIFRKKRLQLPGFFRPTKEWDLVVVKNGHLIAAIEAKSQVGPSFGNNFNNRTEEAMGSALDIWTAFTPTLQKSRMPQIQGVQGWNCSVLPRTLGNEGDAVCSAFPQGKKHDNFNLNSGFHHRFIPKYCTDYLRTLIVIILNMPLSCFLCN